MKSGLYTAQLIAGESTGDYVATRRALIEDFQAYDALALSAVEELTITVVRKNRLFSAERQYMSGIMQTEDARKAVALKLHGNEGHARVIPWWFLETGESDDKRMAMQIYRALDQLDELKAAGVKQGIQALKDACPEAYWLVMRYQKQEGEQFWQVLARVTQKSNVIDCIDAFKAKVNADSERHLDWAKNHRRYQAVINLVYAEFKMQMMAKPEMIKLINSLNRQTEHALQVINARDKMLEDVCESNTLTGSDGCVDVMVAVTQGVDQAQNEAQTLKAVGAGSEALASSPSTVELASALPHEAVEATVVTDSLGADQSSEALTFETGLEAQHSYQAGSQEQASSQSESQS